MAKPAEDGDDGAIKSPLKAHPIGVVAKRLRRQTVAIGDPVIGRDNGMSVDGIGADHARSVPPVAFDTSATIFCDVASISSSVSVRSVG